MRVTVVGCGTAAPDGERVCSGFFVEAAPVRILFDCGAGVVHRMAGLGLPWSDLSHVVITHFHTDHIGDLPMLFFALAYGLPRQRVAPLTVIGPAGTREVLTRLAAAFGEHITAPPFPLEVLEARNEPIDLAPDVTLSSHATPHTGNSRAYRLSAAGATFGYTGDTGPSELVAAFLAGANILVTECSLPDDLAVEGHLTPIGVAAMASIATPALLVISHIYPQLDPSAVAGRIAAAGWQGPVRLAVDGLRLTP